MVPTPLDFCHLIIKQKKYVPGSVNTLKILIISIIVIWEPTIFRWQEYRLVTKWT